MIKSENKPVIILLGVIVAIFLGFIIFLMVMIVPTNSFNIKIVGNEIVIKGKNATDIELENIKKIELLNIAPTIKYNGGGKIGNMIFGHNYMDKLGFTECYINNDNSKVIYIKISNNQFLIGLNNSNDTENLYKKIIKDKNV